MFANYPVRLQAAHLSLRFDFVDTQPPSDQALMAEMLNDIRQRTAALIADRQRLIDAESQWTHSLASLEDQIREQRAQLEERDMRIAGLEAKVTEQQSELAKLRSQPTPLPQPVPSTDPVIGERIRALVEEIDACIARMPRTRDTATLELMSA